MRPLTPCLCFILWTIISGSLQVPWDMKVSPVVMVPRGEEAVLSCSFTHPGQQDYSGQITVKWLARQYKAQPFFSCYVRNDSSEDTNDCLETGLRYSLRGDPRRGDLSLLIREVDLADNGTYFCRVELDGWMSYFQKETCLYVTVKPQILSLSVVETSPGSDSTTQRLRCEVEGHPLPTITWLSDSRNLTKDLVQTSQVGLLRLVSTVPYLEEEVLTCRVENRLGGAERRYPESHTLMITLTVWGLIVLLLLLLLTGFILWRRNRAGTGTLPVYEHTQTVENHRLQDSTELHLVYSTVTLTAQHAGVCQEHPTDVVYSPVNVQSTASAEEPVPDV